MINEAQKYIIVDTNYKIDEDKDAVIIDISFCDPIDKYYPIIKKHSALLFERHYGVECGLRQISIYSSLYGFNRDIILTKNLKKVSFGSTFNTQFNISKHLTCLLFGALFNQFIILTKQLKILHLGQEFNKQIFFSKNLVHLTLSIKYNHPLVVTKHVTSLTFGKDFNQTIILPRSVVHLSIGKFFDKKIHFEYPLKSFSIDHEQPHSQTPKYNSPIIDDLPNITDKGHFILRETFDAPLDNIPNYGSTIVQNHNKKIRHKLPERYKEKCFKTYVWGQK